MVASFAGVCGQVAVIGVVAGIFFFRFFLEQQRGCE